MLVVIHIIIAVSGLLLSGAAFLFPSKARIYASCALVAATLISGTTLVFINHAPLLSACMTGLLYLGVTSIGIAAGYRKLAKEVEIK